MIYNLKRNYIQIHIRRRGFARFMLSKHYYVLDWILVLLPSGLRIRSDPACFPGFGSGFQISLDLDPFCSESLDPDPVNNRPDPKPSITSTNPFSSSANEAGLEECRRWSLNIHKWVGWVYLTEPAVFKPIFN